VKRIPKTTSGKVQRHLLTQSYLDGEFDEELLELGKLRTSHAGPHVMGSDLEGRLQAICEAALPGKRIEVDDNLFEIGASSLKLIEIHENIDRDYPGLVDLTELFDTRPSRSSRSTSRVSSERRQVRSGRSTPAFNRSIAAAARAGTYDISERIGQREITQTTKRARPGARRFSVQPHVVLGAAARTPRSPRICVGAVHRKRRCR